jgi:RNA recognition motif-containing protein
MDIFVGSLPFKMKDAELREIFEQHGEVNSVKIIMDKVTRQNKGFGFVNMLDDRAANAAIKALNGKEFAGRTLIVTRSEETSATKDKRSFTSAGTAGRKSPARGSFTAFKRGGSNNSGFEKREPRSEGGSDFRKPAGEGRGFKRGGSNNSGFEKREPRTEGGSDFRKSTGERGGFKRGGSNNSGFEKREPRSEGGSDFRKSAGERGGFKRGGSNNSGFEKREPRSEGGSDFRKPAGEGRGFKRGGSNNSGFEKREPRAEGAGGFKKSAPKSGFKKTSTSKSPFKKSATGGVKKSSFGRSKRDS